MLETTMSWNIQVNKSHISINPLVKSNIMEEITVSENSSIPAPSESPESSEIKSTCSVGPKESIMKPRYHNGICRCCLSQGKFESMETDNIPAGRKQSYVDMLRETFGLFLSQTKDPRLICSSCAVQLRQTLTFRKQVLASEEALSKTQPKIDFKVEIEVKHEIPFIYELSQEAGKRKAAVDLNDTIGKQENETTTSYKLISHDKVDVKTEHFSSSEEMSNSEIIVESSEQENPGAVQNGLIMCEFCSYVHAPDEYPQCRFCNHVFSSEQDKVVHLICDTIDCAFCNISFLKFEEKIEHMKVCKYFTCFLRRSLIINDESVSMCIEKNIKLELIKHKKNYQCNICKRDHTYEELVAKHKDYKKLTCMHCNKVFLPMELKWEHRKFCKCLKNELKNKKLEEQLKCKLCKTKYETEEEKVKHFRDKHLTCTDCNRVFPSKLERDEHCKKYRVQCEKCNEIFPSLSLKRRHIKQKHGIKCKICDMTVMEHLKIKHDNEFHGGTIPQCGICDLVCKTKTALIKHQRFVHLKERNKHCPKCDFAAFNNYQLKKHMIVHSKNKDFQCNYCQKMFARKRNLECHIRIHTGDKRSVCKICGEAFVQRASLKYHLEKYHPGDKC